MYKQNASYLVKHSDLGANNLNKICPKIVQKLLKWPLQCENFPREHAPGPPRTFFYSQYASKILPEKSTLKNMANWGPSLKKILEYVADMETFSKGC